MNDKSPVESQTLTLTRALGCQIHCIQNTGACYQLSLLQLKKTAARGSARLGRESIHIYVVSEIWTPPNPCLTYLPVIYPMFAILYFHLSLRPRCAISQCHCLLSQLQETDY